MAIILTANLEPAGNFPIVTTEVISGGYQTVATLVDRDAITTVGVDSAIALDGYRREGMLVYVQATGDTYILNAPLTNADWVLQSGGSASYRTPFVNADLVLGILTVVHNLGVDFNTWAIYDNLNAALMPDEAVNIDPNTIAIDLTSYSPIPGTWNVVIHS